MSQTPLTALTGDETAKLACTTVGGPLPASPTALADDPMLFVLRHKTSGQYVKRLLRFLQGCDDWRRAAQPTAEQVREEIRLFAKDVPIWTADLQAAEAWSRRDVSQFEEFLPDVEFVPVQVSVTPS